jgi:hypothetical protein
VNTEIRMGPAIDGQCRTKCGCKTVKCLEPVEQKPISNSIVNRVPVGGVKEQGLRIPLETALASRDSSVEDHPHGIKDSKR